VQSPPAQLETAFYSSLEELRCKIYVYPNQWVKIVGSAGALPPHCQQTDFENFPPFIINSSATLRIFENFKSIITRKKKL